MGHKFLHECIYLPRCNIISPARATVIISLNISVYKWQNKHVAALEKVIVTRKPNDYTVYFALSYKGLIVGKAGEKLLLVPLRKLVTAAKGISTI